MYPIKIHPKAITNTNIGTIRVLIRVVYTTQYNYSIIDYFRAM